MNGADWAIRPATVADFEGVQALLAACGLPSSDLIANCARSAACARLTCKRGNSCPAYASPVR